MKKITTLATAIVMFISASAFSIPETALAPNIKKAFSKQFSSVQKVQWEKINNVYYGSFSVNKSDINVAYSEDGDLLALTKRIQTADLPKNVAQSLINNYDGFIFNLQATEVQVDGNSYYLLSGQDDKKLVNLKCYSDGLIDVVLTIKK